MKHVILSVYDKATEAYMRPFTVISEGQGIRLFEDTVRDLNSDLSKHPEDYALFRLGTFDDMLGEMKPQEPKCLRRAHEVPQVRNTNGE